MNYNDALILFGLTDNYTKEELKKRYLELSKKHHPDLNGDEEMMKKVNAAYDLLKNSNYKSYFAENLNKFEKYKSKIKYPDGSLEEYYKILINRLIDTYGKNIVIGFEERIIYNEIQDMYREYMNKILVREEIYDMIQIDFDQDFDSFVKELNKIVNSFSILNLKKYKGSTLIEVILGVNIILSMFIIVALLIGSNKASHIKRIKIEEGNRIIYCVMQEIKYNMTINELIGKENLISFSLSL